MQILTHTFILYTLTFISTLRWQMVIYTHALTNCNLKVFILALMSFLTPQLLTTHQGAVCMRAMCKMAVQGGAIAAPMDTISTWTLCDTATCSHRWEYIHVFCLSMFDYSIYSCGYSRGYRFPISAIGLEELLTLVFFRGPHLYIFFHI